MLVPLMIFVSGAFMADAWLGHLRIRQYRFLPSLGMSWGIVLPQYIFNVAPTRYAFGTYTAAQMATSTSRRA